MLGVGLCWGDDNKGWWIVGGGDCVFCVFFSVCFGFCLFSFR